MPDEQIEDSTATQINILSPEFQEPMDINLTRGQLLFIYQILERNIRPQGLDMIEFSYDLLNRFRTVLAEESTESEQVTSKSDATVIESDKTATGFGTVHDMSPKTPLGE
jgi:Tfp pilus assembly protein FimV|tara:strand:+ start:52 stop:381 length:330 start_codon:yes stop_codon:yes gene_type:complete